MNQNRKIALYTAIGWLKPGVTLEQAQADMEAISAGLEQAYPDTNKGKYIRLFPPDISVSFYRETFLSLLGAAGFLLLIACSNIASLFLARGTARYKEMAIRSALGASRFRLVRQMLTEGMLVAAAGGQPGC